MDFDQAQVEQYRPIVARYAAFYFGLPPPTGLGLAQIAQESGFRTDAKSRTGALGLQQFMPATWKWAVTAAGLPADAKPTDPEAAIRAGQWYMRHLYDRARYKNECDRWGATLSGYNGGSGWEQKRRGRAADPQDFWWSVRQINPGITEGNQRENSEYPYRIVYRLQPQFLRVGDRKVCLS